MTGHSAASDHLDERQVWAKKNPLVGSTAKTALSALPSLTLGPSDDLVYWRSERHL